MALATKCPHCNTIFRVAHDQLKLRGGIVRCGACNEVFDGNAALVEPHARPIATPLAPEAQAAPAAPPHALDAKLEALDSRAAQVLQAEDEEPIHTLQFDAADHDGVHAAAVVEAEPPAPHHEPLPDADTDTDTDADAAPAPAPEPAPLTAADFPPPAALADFDLDFDLDLPPEDATSATGAEAEPAPAVSQHASSPARAPADTLASTLAASDASAPLAQGDDEDKLDLDIAAMSDTELEAALQAELAAIDIAEADLAREAAAAEADLARATAAAEASEAAIPASRDAPAGDDAHAAPGTGAQGKHASGDAPAAFAASDAFATSDADNAHLASAPHELTAADMPPPGIDGRREPTFGEPTYAEPPLDGSTFGEPPAEHLVAAAISDGRYGHEDDAFDDEEEALVQLSAAGVARSGRDAAHSLNAPPHSLEAPSHSLDAPSHSLDAELHSLDADTAVADELARDAGGANASAADSNDNRADAGENENSDDAAPEEPGFVKRANRRQRLGKVEAIVMGIGSVLLLGALAGQVVATFRNPLAAALPQLKPALSAACAALGCKVELPTQIDNVTIEQGELQTLSENTFSFTTLLRNQGASAQAWPNIELVLDDDKDKAILRRVFTPADYLAPGAAQAPALAQGFAPHSEQSVKLYFELKQLKASGYHIAVFYP